MTSSGYRPRRTVLAQSASGVVGFGELRDPLAGGGEQDPVSPAWQARIDSPIPKWVLPVPGGPRT